MQKIRITNLIGIVVIMIFIGMFFGSLYLLSQTASTVLVGVCGIGFTGFTVSLVGFFVPKQETE
jgi:hypothetical protein